MKFSVCAILVFVNVQACAQAVDTISVCTDRTVYVLLKGHVSLVDLGTKQDYAFQVNENVVMLKAIRKDVRSTSLMIKTDTNVYVYIIRYRQDPPALLIDLRAGKKIGKDLIAATTANTADTLVQHVGPARNEASGAFGPGHHTMQVPDKQSKYFALQQPAIIGKRSAIGNRDVHVRDEEMQKKIYFILGQKQHFRDMGEIENGIYFSLHDLYVDSKFLYIKLTLFNTSSIAFDIDLVYLERSNGKSFKKREALASVPVPFVYQESVFMVHPAGEEVVVYVVDLFAYREKDRLLVSVHEREGVRSLQLSIPAKEIVNAKSL